MMTCVMALRALKKVARRRRRICHRFLILLLLFFSPVTSYRCCRQFVRIHHPFLPLLLRRLMSLRHTDWHCQWIENITGTTALCNSNVAGGGGCYRSARSPPPHSRHINCRRLAVVVVAAAVAVDKGAAAKLCALLL